MPNSPDQDKQYALDLKRALVCGKCGASNDGKIAFDSDAIYESAARLGMDLGSSKKVFAALRSFGFENHRAKNGQRVATDVINFAKICIEVAPGIVAELEAEKAKRVKQ